MRPQPRSTRFAGPSNPFVFAQPGGAKIQQLLWGDWLRLKRGRKRGGWVEVRARGCDGWMRSDEIQRERILEVAFVDIGQGDGCLVVTPDDEHIVIDAGADDSMYRFLSWRYGGFREPWAFDAAIISHPDADHYGGFSDLFDLPNVTFDTIYHNGILEHRGKRPLGRRAKIDGRSCVTELCASKTQLKAFLSRSANWRHPKKPHLTARDAALLAKGVRNESFRQLESLSRNTHEHVPGWGPGRTVELEVLGPVRDGNGKRSGLRWLGDKGKTKNGHSIVLKLRFKDVTMLLGGDLNIPSQELLLEHHTGLDPRPKSRDEHDALVRAARQVFQVDVAKACHHGSADVSTRFLDATNPIVTVISSGDDESYFHPRADALGATGRFGRGNRPLVFSTELARSGRNAIRQPEVLKERLRQLKEQARLAPEGSALARMAEREVEEVVSRIDRSVAVFGTIQLRTDGRSVLLAQKIEKPRGDRRWDTYTLVNRGGVLRYESRYD